MATHLRFLLGHEDAEGLDRELAGVLSILTQLDDTYAAEDSSLF